MRRQCHLRGFAVVRHDSDLRLQPDLLEDVDLSGVDHMSGEPDLLRCGVNLCWSGDMLLRDLRVDTQLLGHDV